MIDANSKFIEVSATSSARLTMMSVKQPCGMRDFGVRDPSGKELQIGEATVVYPATCCVLLVVSPNIAFKIGYCKRYFAAHA